MSIMYSYLCVHIADVIIATHTHTKPGRQTDYTHVMKSRNWPSGSMACARRKLNSSTSLLVVPPWIKPGEMVPED